MNHMNESESIGINQGFHAWIHACLVVILAVASATAANGQANRLLPGHIPPEVSGLRPSGDLDPETNLQLSIGLPLRNTEALTNLLEALYDPSSPQHRQFLTPEQFTERFGPTAQDYQAVMQFVAMNGLQTTATHSNRLLLNVSGPVRNIEKAFGLRLKTYKHPRENRSFYAPDVNPSIPAHVPILHIGGLNNFTLPHPIALHKKPLIAGAQAVANAGSGPSGNYIGKDFRAAYAPGVTLNGAGQTLALVQFDGYYPADITQYASKAGLPGVPLQNVLLDGFNGVPGDNNDEVALDIEMAISMAPGLSKIIVYEAGPYGSGNDILNRIAMDNQAKQISASWGFGTTPTTTQILQQFAAQGQTYFNASGDSDAYTGTISPPSDNPYLTAVGGTTLSTAAPGGPWSSERVWNWGGGQGSSGGISTYWSIPKWQQGIDLTASGGSAMRRNIPDVAMVADDIYVISSNGKASAVGGTSCASPLWAAFIALVNQQAAGNGKPPVGFLNPTIYALGKSSDYQGALHDITLGDNTSPSSPAGFYAVGGYDLCTGWGTPVGQALINKLSGTSNMPATLQPPQLLNARFASGTMTFSFQSVLGQSYIVEYKTSMSDPAWTPLQSFTGTGTMQTITDRTSVATQRFYRVHAP